MPQLIGAKWGATCGKLALAVKKYVIKCIFPAKYAEKPLKEGCGSRILLQ
jgi:hypothetical protein